MTPSVPHDPVRSRVRSKPATFFTTRPPPRTVAPRPLTNSTPSARSRGVPKRVASGPAAAGGSGAWGGKGGGVRGVVGAERIQREPLAVRGNRVVNLAQRRARFGGQREIAGRVLGDAGVRGE